MENQFVPYELAVKLEELGFNEPCLMHWFQYWAHELPKNLRGGEMIANEGNPIRLSRITTPELNRDLKCGAPLWQQAFDWFRKKHGLHAIVYQVELEDKSIMWYWDIVDNGSEEGVYEEPLCKTYEEARYACLEKLIELITEN